MNFSAEVVNEKARWQGPLRTFLPLISNKLIGNYIKILSLLGQKVYCYLCDNFLFVYKSQYAREPLLQIQLKGAYETINQLDKTKEMYKFELIHCAHYSNSPIYFASDSMFDLKNWLQYIKEEVEKFSDSNRNEVTASNDNIKPPSSNVNQAQTAVPQVPPRTLKNQTGTNNNQSEYNKLKMDDAFNNFDEELAPSTSLKPRNARFSTKPRQIPPSPNVAKPANANSNLINNNVNNKVEARPAAAIVPLPIVQPINENYNELEDENEYEENRIKEADVYWKSIWWDDSSDSATFLHRINEDGVFLVRKSNKPNEKRHVLVVHSTQFSQPKSCKYHINEKMENDEKVFYIDNGIAHLSIEELCNYYTKHSLPLYNRKSDLCQNIEIILKTPIHIAIKNKNLKAPDKRADYITATSF